MNDGQMVDTTFRHMTTFPGSHVVFLCHNFINTKKDPLDLCRMLNN